MTKGSRLAIVAGIMIAAAGVSVAAFSMPGSPPTPPADNGNGTNSQPQQIVVNLNENLTVNVIK